MSAAKEKPPSRDAERSREAILDAAEQLFAAKGFEETSLQEIGQHAGVSRGTPNYFFGSKEQLYIAVLERVLQAEQDFLTQMQANLTSSDKPGWLIAQVTGYFLDFLLARPTYVPLIERESLNNARFLQGRSSYLTVLEQGLNLLKFELASDKLRPQDPLQLLLSVIALCWFPIAHQNTFMQPLGIKAADKAFWESRKQHIVDLLMHGILAN